MTLADRLSALVALIEAWDRTRADTDSEPLTFWAGGLPLGVAAELRGLLTDELHPLPRRLRRPPAWLSNLACGIAVLVALPWAAGWLTRQPRPHRKDPS